MNFSELPPLVLCWYKSKMRCSIKHCIDNLTLQRSSNNKNRLTDIIFVMKFFTDDLFRAAPYSLMLVLIKDVLFH
jgi:hypothetical protein